jgi:hypothetical protein
MNSPHATATNMNFGGIDYDRSTTIKLKYDIIADNFKQHSDVSEVNMARPRIIEKDALSMQLKKAEYLISHADITEPEKAYNFYNYRGKKLNTIFFRKVKKVGQGGQGIVYQIEIEGRTHGHYVDKMARFEGIKAG